MVYYGLYFVVFRLWIQILSLILDVLTSDGHKIELKQMSYWNLVELYVNGEMVFKCDIRDLDYGNFLK